MSLPVQSTESRPHSIFVWLAVIVLWFPLGCALGDPGFPALGLFRPIMLIAHALIGIDAWRIDRSYYVNPKSGEVVGVDRWMLLGIFLILPLYLFRRARVVGDGYWYLLAWLVSFISSAFLATALGA